MKQVCRNCKWWWNAADMPEFSGDPNWGECQMTRRDGTQFDHPESKAVANGLEADHEQWLDTHADFGCNQWKPEWEQES